MINLSPYSHTPVADTPEGVNSALRDLARDADLLRNEPTVPLRTTAPEKPHTGLLVFADGVSFDPGSGRGVYVWDDEANAGAGGWIPLF
jgi:hypothetical protein